MATMSMRTILLPLIFFLFGWAMQQQRFFILWRDVNGTPPPNANAMPEAIRMFRLSNRNNYTKQSRLSNLHVRDRNGKINPVNLVFLILGSICAGIIGVLGIYGICCVFYFVYLFLRGKFGYHNAVAAWANRQPGVQLPDLQSGDSE